MYSPRVSSVPRLSPSPPAIAGSGDGVPSCPLWFPVSCSISRVANRMPPSEISWSSIPTDILRAELSRRADGDDARPECGSGKQGSYHTGLHVFALFLILAVSTAGKKPSPFLSIVVLPLHMGGTPGCSQS